jgi:hypothetical protein
MFAVLVVVAAVLTPSVAAARAPAMAPVEAPEGQQCVVSNLIVCTPAILAGRTPSAECCSNLKAQQGCFCGYAENPFYKHYINSPNSLNTLATCGISIPDCSK